MTRLRFTLISLTGFVLIVALGCAALSSASRAWAQAIFTLTILALMIAVLGAVLGRRADRAFWTGFALFGGTYILSVFTPLQNHIGQWFVWNSLLDSLRTSLEERRSLPSTAAGVPGTPISMMTEERRNLGHVPGGLSAMKVSDPTLLRTTVDNDGAGLFGVTAGKRPGIADVTATYQDGSQLAFRVTVHLNQENFDRTGHSLASLLLALIGGLIGRYFHSTREAQSQQHLGSGS